jgi:hypothetical protein
MTKMIIDAPAELHRMIKAIASANGESMKNLILRSIESIIKKETGIDIKKPNGSYISEKESHKTIEKLISASFKKRK